MKVPFKIRPGLLLCLGALGLALAGAGCDSQGAQDAFEDQASAVPSGITETNMQGDVLVADEDDWRTSPLYVGEITVSPAYPNPAPLGALVRIQVNINFEARGSLVLEALDVNRRPFVLDEVVSRNPGFEEFVFSPGLLGPGLHRLFVFDAVGEIVSYGDVRVLEGG